MKRMKSMGAIALVAALLISADALAAGSDGEGFAVGRFDPSERGSLWLTQESLDFRGEFRFSAGLTLDYAKRPLGIYDADDELVADLLAHQLYAHLGASFVFLNRLRLGVSVPVVLYQDGKASMINGTNFASPKAVAMGDLRLGADVRLFGEYGDAFTLAFGAQLYLPTGKRDQYTGDEGVRVQPRVMVAGQVGNFVYAAKVGFHYRANDDESLTGEFELGSELNLGAAVGWLFLDKKLLVGPEFNGGTVVTQGGKNTFDSKTSPAEVLLGARYAFDSGVTLAGGGGLGLWRALGSPQMRWVFSVGYEMPANQKKSDVDSDGVPDELDACPCTPGVSHIDPAKNGCPADLDEDGIPDAQDACPDMPGIVHHEPAKHGCPLDSDEDGIADVEDACPKVPGVKSADPKRHGCPPDRDGDGVIDAEDACPDVKGVASTDPQKNGCPPDRDGDGVIDAEDACPDVKGRASKSPERNGCPPDRDGDGVIDAEDACPDVKGVANADPRKNGCPINPDRDGDGIPNEKDACPDEKGAPSKHPERNGCPKVFIQGEQIVIQDQVRFVTGSAKIAKTPQNQKTLKAVKAVLDANQRIKSVRVEGHTDNVGAAQYNRKLSADRAASVVHWLVEAGIAEGRLTSEGFGADRPIAPNKTAKGRALNRRVEFHIVEIEPEVW